MNTKYEVFVKKILAGLSNLELSKLVNNKRIKISGFTKVTEKNRDFILNSLMNKKNIDTIYELMINKSVYTMSLDLEIKDDKNLWNLFNNMSDTFKGSYSEYTSLFLIKVYQEFGLEVALNFFIENENQIEKNEKEKMISNSFIDKKEFENMKKMLSIMKDNETKSNSKIKKLEKEKINWNDVEKNLNSKIKELEEKYFYELKKNKQLEDDKKILEKRIEENKLEVIKLHETVKELEIIISNLNKHNKEKSMEEIVNNKVLLIGNPKNSKLINNKRFVVYENEDLTELIMEINSNNYEEVWVLEYLLSRPFIKEIKRANLEVSKKMFSSFIEIIKEIEK
ncbi:hypothetical protein IGJ22_002321 [Enterococcus sp. DIV0448]|uniref:hypothetical protein n=1 Tax=unclassified Enterococcus TaxID=2608891 RepID=UPI0019D838C8